MKMKKKEKKSNQVLEKYQFFICIVGVPEGNSKKKGTEIVKEIMTENIPNIKPYIKKFSKHHRR